MNARHKLSNLAYYTVLAANAVLWETQTDCAHAVRPLVDEYHAYGLPVAREALQEAVDEALDILSHIPAMFVDSLVARLAEVRVTMRAVGVEIDPMACHMAATQECGDYAGADMV